MRGKDRAQGSYQEVHGSSDKKQFYETATVGNESMPATVFRMHEPYLIPHFLRKRGAEKHFLES